MGQLSTAMRTELQKGTGAVVFDVLELTISGTTYRYSTVGAALAGSGTYEAKLLSRGEVARSRQLRYASMEFPTVDVILDDSDQAFARIVEGSTAYAVRGSTAVLKLASPNVASANWFTLFSGRIEALAQPSQLAWQITLAPNHLPLQRESVPKGVISVSDFPSSALSVRDSPLPIIYGRVSSANGANNGAVSCPYVDSAGYRYLVCAGAAKAVDTVYVSGTPTAASNYAVTRPVINGRTFTLIDFTSSQGAATITADVQGYETVGDGSGALITDPPTILAHLLTNWVYGDYRTGAWASTASVIDTTSFGTTFYSDRGAQMSLYLATKRRGGDVINDFCGSFEAKVHWMNSGKIALGIEDPTAWAYVTDYIVREDDPNAEWTWRQATDNLVDSVSAQWLQTPTGGYQQQLRVANLRTGEQAPEQIQLPFSPAFVL